MYEDTAWTFVCTEIIAGEQSKRAKISDLWIFGTPPSRVDSLLNNITVNDTSSFDLSALGERVQVGRRHPAGVLKSDVNQLQRDVSWLFFKHII
jgi:hypothetical protein